MLLVSGMKLNLNTLFSIFNAKVSLLNFMLKYFTYPMSKLYVSRLGGAWQWHGNFNYAEMDKSIATYFDCINKSMEADCNTQLVDKVRSCNSAN